MIFGKVYSILVFIFAVGAVYSGFTFPEIQLEALRSGGFRAYITDVPGITRFTFHGNLNQDILPHSLGQFNKETTAPQKGYWVLEFPQQLTTKDVINYWANLTLNSVIYRKDEQSWEVKELLDSYFSFECVKSLTVIDGRSDMCVGQSIFSDDFKNDIINKETWITEHRLPDYPNREFNYYQDMVETIFRKDNVLYLRPLPLESDEEVRTPLDLTGRCTSNIKSKCSYKRKSSFLPPPVKSARITSKASFKYGRIQIRAKLPTGDWIFPIMQLESKNDDYDNLTKVWIAFSRGNDHLTDIKGDDIGSRLLLAGRVLPLTESARSKELVEKRSSNSYNSNFHVYTLNWAPDTMTFSVDSEEYGTIDSSPFDREYVLSLGVGVGGSYNFPDNYTSGGNIQKPWSNIERDQVKKFFEARNIWMKTWNANESALQIDYVKVTAV